MGKKVAEIPTDAHPESVQLEKTGTRVFVNVPDKQEVEVADLVKGTVLAHWLSTSCTTNFYVARRSSSPAVRGLPDSSSSPYSTPKLAKLWRRLRWLNILTTSFTTPARVECTSLGKASSTSGSRKTPDCRNASSAFYSADA